CLLQALKKRGCKRLILQFGNGTFVPETGINSGIQIESYRFKDSLAKDMAKADVVISHAGAGSCLEALEAKKKLLVVVNDSLMHNHQVELAEKLHQEGYLHFTTCGELPMVLETVDFLNIKSYPKSESSVFAKYIDRVMGFDE
ncbi:hypothetical protein AAG570_005779, partial [Ranatra chinensis]